MQGSELKTIQDFSQQSLIWTFFFVFFRWFSLGEVTSKKIAAENLASQLNNKLADSESERWYDRVHKFFSSWRSQNDKTISFRASVWTYKTKPNVQK